MEELLIALKEVINLHSTIKYSTSLYFIEQHKCLLKGKAGLVT